MYSDAGKMGRRRQRYGSMASTLSEDSAATSVDVATNTIVDYETNADVVDSIAKRVDAEVVINQEQVEEKENYEKSNGYNAIFTIGSVNHDQHHI